MEGFEEEASLRRRRREERRRRRRETPHVPRQRGCDEDVAVRMAKVRLAG
jgi:hypothetical protein